MLLIKVSMNDFIILLLRLLKEPFLLANLLILLTLTLTMVLALKAVFSQGGKSRSTTKIHCTIDITIES